MRARMLAKLLRGKKMTHQYNRLFYFKTKFTFHNEAMRTTHTRVSLRISILNKKIVNFFF